MSDKFFLDTNILIYAYDGSDPAKHAIALSLIEAISKSGTPVVSTQVLQEFAAAVRRKAKPLLSTRKVQEILVEILQAWEVFVGNAVTIISALEIEERFKVFFWDALILSAAHSSSATILYTEDLNHGQTYGSVQVVNPFKA